MAVNGVTYSNSNKEPQLRDFELNVEHIESFKKGEHRLPEFTLVGTKVNY